jgi:VanZ family protein
MLKTVDTPRRPATPLTRRRLLAWAPPVAWAALIFIASAQPGLRFVPDEGLDFIVRKLGHMAVFGILALLLWRAFATTTAVRRPWAWALALTVLYAVTDELHQAFVAGRTSSARDVAIDAAGAVIAVAVVVAVAARTRSRPSRGDSG